MVQNYLIFLTLDSPPHHPFSDSAEILRISGRGICKEAIFSPGGKLPSEKISTIPPHRSPGSIGSREGSHPLELSETVLARILVSDDAGAILLNAFVSDGAGRGALRSPTPPRATGCERGASLSRSPGAGLAGSLVSDDAGGCPFDGVRFRQCRGCPFDDVRFRQCGAVLLTAFVSDKAGTALLRFFFPDGASVGRSAPLHSLGRRGARGLRPSRALPGLF